MIFRNPDVRIQTIINTVLTLAGFIFCLFLNVYAAFVLLGISALMLGINLCFQRKHLRNISNLCERVEETLHGVENTVFQEFQEGEFSILASEIHKMTVRLREQNSKLSHEQEFMKEAMEDISHQLRTPLTSTMLIVEMMRDTGLSQRERMEYLQELNSLLARMKWLIETMLTISRLDAGAVNFQKTQVSCKNLIDMAIEPISIAMELKDIAVEISIEENPEFYGDFQYCTEAVTNLLKNCMEHTPQGGRIKVEARENGIYTEIVITDSGNGIDEKDLPHIFERFYRSSEFAKSGYGIGLSFAQKIIVAQNGSLRVRNAVPNGAEFEIRLYKTVV